MSSAAWPRLISAVTGLLLVSFLVLHLAGASLAALAPTRFEATAAWLHGQPWLPAAELLLAGAALLHPALALVRRIDAARARGPQPALLASRRQDPLAVLAARSAPWSGALLLVFLVVHLAQLRWSRPPAGAELAALLAALAAPPARLLYVAAGLAVGLHLLHGNESAHRSLGLLDRTNAERIRSAGRILAVALGGGFALLPLALLLGGSGGLR